MKTIHLSLFALSAGLVVAVSAGACDGTAAQSFPEPAVHRAQASTCSAERPTTDWSEQLAYDKSAGWGPIKCERDSDCTEQPDGRCARMGDGWYECTYHGCMEDADCGANEVCGCGVWFVGANACLPAGCKVDADCASGWCVPSPTQYQPELSGLDRRYECVTAADECVQDSDCQPCPSDNQADCAHPGWCKWDTDEGHRVCSWDLTVQ